MIEIFVIYFVLSVVTIISKYYSNTLYNYSKGLPLLFLIVCLCFKIHFNNLSVVLLILVGLFFGLVGDLLLLNSNKFFKLGLSAFLVNHILYSIFFYNYVYGINFRAVVLVLIVLLFYGYYLLTKIKKSLKIPVFLYLITISTMVILTFSTKGLSVFVSIGSIFFALSDGILSYNKFVKEFKLAELLILSTYFTAQLLIGYFCVY